MMSWTKNARVSAEKACSIRGGISRVSSQRAPELLHAVQGCRNGQLRARLARRQRIPAPAQRVSRVSRCDEGGESSQDSSFCDASTHVANPRPQSWRTRRPRSAGVATASHRLWASWSGFLRPAWMLAISTSIAAQSVLAASAESPANVASQSPHHRAQVRANLSVSRGVRGLPVGAQEWGAADALA